MILDFDFDHVFQVDTAGKIDDQTPHFAPEVYHSDDIDIEIVSDDWEAFSVGYTGQYGYNGAVMHPSEHLGGRLADDILATPGFYVITVVEVYPEAEYEHPEPAGWTVLRRRDGAA